MRCGAIEVDKTVLSVGGREPGVDLSANFTLIPAHRALCLYSFEVRTHLKRRQSSRARAERSNGRTDCRFISSHENLHVMRTENTQLSDRKDIGLIPGPSMRPVAASFAGLQTCFRCVNVQECLFLAAMCECKRHDLSGDPVTNKWRSWIEAWSHLLLKTV